MELSMKKILVMSLGLFTTSVFAGECNINLETTESMAYKTNEIVIKKSCSEVTLNFKNNGTFPKAVMGHNVVISKKLDMEAILKDGMPLGLAKNYLKDNDARVVVASNVMGGGESTSVKFKTSSMNTKEPYVFFCSFPGHSAVMKGNVIFK
jgi:azurin